MTEHDDLQAWLTLMRTPGVGALAVRRWLRGAGDIHAAVALARREPALAKAARDWLGKPDAQRLAHDMDWLAQPGHRLVCCTQADFPPQLDALPGAPAALFVNGDAGLLLRPQIAIVGARGASPAGLANARLFARALAATGLVVTSGLAEGVDGAAHASALDAGTTIAVMGTGPDKLYPRRHRDLAASIAQGGALVSEFVPGTGPRAGHFPRRNRIISGLSLGTLVIEASVRSGSLITARLAAEQGRAVFALPGSIHNPLARGCHRLIREGVQLVETVDEIIDALRPMARALGDSLEQRLGPDPQAAPSAGREAVATDMDSTLESASRRLLEALGHGDPVAADTLSERTGLPMKEVSAMLLTLELDGHVAGASGGRYLRTD
ncbi:MAG TPA: DNA-processing protein DprA [Oleiagrimonas sp.]|nr:DNA-processing protein DprA [Oleiagrimonas sp.]